MKKYLAFIFILAALASCQKPEPPSGTNKIVFGQTTADSVGYYTAIVSTILTSGLPGNTIIQHGHCWSTKSNPTTDDAKTTLGKPDTTGTFFSQLTGLQDNTTYNIRSYITYLYGTVYGKEQTITTLKAGKPRVNTSAVTHITRTSATCGGTNDDGGFTVTAHGVCWNTTGNPTLENSTDHTTDGNGTGNFTSSITEITKNTTYYVAAYATNEKGTGYGEVKSFKTNEFNTPVITTADISVITPSTATSGGTITGENIGTITARGVCWNTTGNPTLENSTGHTTDGNGTDSFTSNITGLTKNTTYYVAAYATNEDGTAYGQAKEFKTTEFMQLVFVQGGTFQMGCTSEQSDCYSFEKPVHTVTVDDFYIGKYEITQKQWKEIMGNNPSYFTGDNLPVEQVSWYDVQEFISILNKKTGRHYRLPTEAEWEYAARGGVAATATTYAGSNNIDAVAWYDDNSGGHTHEVGTKAPNELGIYDMSGNVWEWCSDWYDNYYYGNSPQNNPQEPTPGTEHVLRGGSWRSHADHCRVTYRSWDYSGAANYNVGFRIVLQY